MLRHYRAAAIHHIANIFFSFAAVVTAGGCAFSIRDLGNESK
jgi:hypothetical protein